jgi:hypothetical protein
VDHYFTGKSGASSHRSADVSELIFKASDVIGALCALSEAVHVGVEVRELDGHREEKLNPVKGGVSLFISSCVSRIGQKYG